jgi:hypothetical protein
MLFPSLVEYAENENSEIKNMELGKCRRILYLMNDKKQDNRKGTTS